MGADYSAFRSVPLEVMYKLRKIYSKFLGWLRDMGGMADGIGGILRTVRNYGDGRVDLTKDVVHMADQHHLRWRRFVFLVPHDYHWICGVGE